MPAAFVEALALSGLIAAVRERRPLLFVVTTYLAGAVEPAAVAAGKLGNVVQWVLMIPAFACMHLGYTSVSGEASSVSRCDRRSPEREIGYRDGMPYRCIASLRW